MRRDGSGQRKILNHKANVAFMPDSKTIVWVHDGRMGNVVLNEGAPELGETPWRPIHRFSVYGKVQDNEGRPIANAKIRVATGSGTLRTWKPAHSDEKGEYRISFGPGLYRIDDPVQLQAANVAVEMEGYYEETLGKKGQLAMAYQRPEEADEKWYRDIVYERHPYRLNFVLRRSAQLRARLIARKVNRLRGMTYRSMMRVNEKAKPWCR